MNIEKFCEKYLGNVLSITRLYGGLMHKMFKVETDKGVYCVKVLNPEVMSRSDAYNNFVVSEHISHFVKDNGIDVSSAIEIDGNYLVKMDDTYYMVFDFVFGKTLKDEEITIDHCKKIGNILAHIHLLDYRKIGLESNIIEYTREYDWESYISNPNFSSMSYKDEFLKNYKNYYDLLRKANECFNKTNVNQALCHSDMDPKNVMWSDRPIIIDWESAHVANPERELLEDALCWSGFLSNNFSSDKFLSVFREYFNYRKVDVDWYSVIYGNLVGRLGWLKYNLERSLGIVSNDLEEMELACNEVIKTIDEINRYLDLVNTMEGLINSLKTEDIINTIISKYDMLKGLDCKFINKGFTNTIYSIGDYIVRICTNTDNEAKFKNEIDYYLKNKDNPYIPKLYYFSTDKDDVPYYYEIIEKINGVPLYSIWYTFSEEQREDVIRQLCLIMKSFHKNVGPKRDWISENKDKFSSLYSKAKEKGIFDKEECDLIDYAFSKFDRYLDSSTFVLVHNDLHFDNVFYCDGDIKVIDFERSMYAPADYELSIIYNMVRKPWKFASLEDEKNVDMSQYSYIMTYIEKYYSELINVPNLYQRLAIYDMIYYLRHLLNYPDSKELKNDVIFSSIIVALKDELSFDNLKNPRDLMDFMNININYGWVDVYGNKHINRLDGFRENYRINSLEEVLETGLGTCIEQAMMIKAFFDRMGIDNRLYCHRSYETEDNFDEEVRMHCFILFKHNDMWYHFEHANRPKRGIHRYKSIDEALNEITKGFDEHGDIRKLTLIDSIPVGLSFKEFNEFVNEFDVSK